MTAKDPEARIAYRDTLHGPRWAGVGEFLKNCAWVASGVTLTEFEEDKGWIHTTVRYEVRGKRRDVYRFLRAMYATLNEYNEGAL